MDTVIIMNSVRVSPRLGSRNVVKFRLIELSQWSVLEPASSTMGVMAHTGPQYHGVNSASQVRLNISWHPLSLQLRKGCKIQKSVTFVTPRLKGVGG